MDLGTELDFTPVTLVDRACLGGFEIRHDGRPWVFAPGQIELNVPHFVAAYVLASTQVHVHTTEGEYVCRVAVKQCPRTLLDAIGPEAGDCSPIEIRSDVVEGWAAPERTPSTAVVRHVRVPLSELRERQGAKDSTFAATGR